MKYKLNGFIFTAIVAAAGLISIAGTASAQTIPGTYIEIDAVSYTHLTLPTKRIV